MAVYIHIIFTYSCVSCMSCVSYISCVSCVSYIYVSYICGDDAHMRIVHE